MAEIESTALYARIMARWAGDPGKLALHHQVWDPTPWVIDVYVGRMSKGDRDEIEPGMIRWMTDNIGKESWPIHDRPKPTWHRGGATVDGFTWIGFGTEAQMNDFIAEFPDQTGLDPYG